MRNAVGSKWRWTVNRPGGGSPIEDIGTRFQQDELRHLLATAGAMPWGITDVHRMAPPQAGSVHGL